MSKQAEELTEDMETMLDIFKAELGIIKKEQPGIEPNTARVEAILPTVVKFMYNQRQNTGESNGNNQGNGGQTKGRNSSSRK